MRGVLGGDAAVSAAALLRGVRRPHAHRRDVFGLLIIS